MLSKIQYSEDHNYLAKSFTCCFGVESFGIEESLYKSRSDRLSTLSPHLLGRSSARSDLDRGPLYDLGVNGRCHPDREISAIAMSIETDGRPHL